MTPVSRIERVGAVWNVYCGCGKFVPIGIPDEATARRLLAEHYKKAGHEHWVSVNKGPLEAVRGQP